MSTFQYTMQHGETDKKISHFCTFDSNNNIIKECWEDFSRRCSKDIHELALEYELIDLQQIRCFGCINGCCGQKDHMECDTGCLHDPKNCDICQ